jgi:hypothetical protein
MSGSFSKSLVWVLAVAVSSFVAVGLTACGGGGGSASGASGDVVANVGQTAITKAAVSHWMATLAGGDYYELSGRRPVPTGLVSDPPDYPDCVARLEAAAASSPTKGTKLTGGQLLAKCQQLYAALKQQAAAFLVRAQLTIGMAREAGVTVTDGEVQQFFKRVSAERFPSEAKFREDIAKRRASVVDELLILKLDLLAQKLQQKTGGEKQTLVKFAEAERRWNARTSCSTGYVVQHCKQYTGGSSSTPPPAILMEQVARIATGRCVNLAACGKQ